MLTCSQEKKVVPTHHAYMCSQKEKVVPTHHAYMCSQEKEVVPKFIFLFGITVIFIVTYSAR